MRTHARAHILCTTLLRLPLVCVYLHRAPHLSVHAPFVHVAHAWTATPRGHSAGDHRRRHGPFCIRCWAVHLLVPHTCRGLTFALRMRTFTFVTFTRLLHGYVSPQLIPHVTFSHYLVWIRFLFYGRPHTTPRISWHGFALRDSACTHARLFTRPAPASLPFTHLTTGLPLHSFRCHAIIWFYISCTVRICTLCIFCTPHRLDACALAFTSSFLARYAPFSSHHAGLPRIVTHSLWDCHLRYLTAFTHSLYLTPSTSHHLPRTSCTHALCLLAFSLTTQVTLHYRHNNAPLVSATFSLRDHITVYMPGSVLFCWTHTDRLGSGLVLGLPLRAFLPATPRAVRLYCLVEGRFGLPHFTIWDLRNTVDLLDFTFTFVHRWTVFTAFAFRLVSRWLFCLAILFTCSSWTTAFTTPLLPFVARRCITSSRGSTSWHENSGKRFVAGTFLGYLCLLCRSVPDFSLIFVVRCVSLRFAAASLACCLTHGLQDLGLWFLIFLPLTRTFTTVSTPHLVRVSSPSHCWMRSSPPSFDLPPRLYWDTRLGPRSGPPFYQKNSVVKRQLFLVYDNIIFSPSYLNSIVTATGLWRAYICIRLPLREGREGVSSCP